jgi:hypothetical protein
MLFPEGGHTVAGQVAPPNALCAYTHRINGSQA